MGCKEALCPSEGRGELASPAAPAYVAPHAGARTTRRRWRPSISSTFAQADTPDAPPTPSVSCVTRATYEEDCARQRFIAWAAVKRNSSSRITAEQKLQCPLLQCTQRCADHEAMLQHLAQCPYLWSGQYWCYDHMTVECFDDVKCNRCLGHPSRRRRMLSLAKNFFHSLGHRSTKAPARVSDPSCASLPPPSYDSLGISSSPGLAELSATEVAEIDSTEVFPATRLLSQYDGVAEIARLPAVPELNSPSSPSEHPAQWQPASSLLGTATHFVSTQHTSFPEQASGPSLAVDTDNPLRTRRVSRPVPQLAPSVAHSLSTRSTASTNSNISNISAASTYTTCSNVSSLVSPISVWSDGLSKFQTAPATPSEPATLEPSLPDIPFSASHDEGVGARFDYACCELPADVPPPGELGGALLAPPPSLLFGGELPTITHDVAGPHHVVGAEAAGEQPTSEPRSHRSGLEQSNICCSETKSLVALAWDALREHIESSMRKMRETRHNHLATQLFSMPAKLIATTGLRTLQDLLMGSPVASTLDILCFTHLSYAFALVMHEQEAGIRSDNMFRQSLSYAAQLPWEDRELYRQIVYAIWQPTSTDCTDTSGILGGLQSGLPTRLASSKGKETESSAACCPGDPDADVLLVVARNFLDALESSVVLAPPTSSIVVQTSDLYTKHLLSCDPEAVSPAFPDTVHHAADLLRGCFADVGDLTRNLNELDHRVRSGVVPTVRRFEIELLKTGKGCMCDSRFYDEFVPAVRRLCDQAYPDPAYGSSSRAAYHCLGANLMKSIVPELASATDSEGGDSMPEIEWDLDDFLNISTSTYRTNPATEPVSSQQGTPLATVDPRTLNNIGAGSLEVLPSFNMPALDPPSDAMLIQSEDDGLTQAEAEQAVQQQQQGPTPKTEVESNSCCGICGYRPKGDPKWFRGSMNRHVKLMHSPNDVIYRCPFPGCTSQYTNRPDNLRHHQIEKCHFVGEQGTSRRPSKRKKTATGDDNDDDER